MTDPHDAPYLEIWEMLFPGQPWPWMNVTYGYGSASVTRYVLDRTAWLDRVAAALCPTTGLQGLADALGVILATVKRWKRGGPLLAAVPPRQLEKIRQLAANAMRGLGRL